MRFLKSQTYHYTSIGGRSNNQDSLWYSEDEEKGIWVIADGLGGHRRSETASAAIIQTVENVWKKIPEMEYKELFLQCHKEIKSIQKEHPGAGNAASTMVLARKQGRIFSCAHAGDSRLYYFRNGQLLFRTKDHSIAQMNVTLGEIAEKELRTSPDRNKLYNVLGGEQEPKTEVRAPFVMEKGDAFLLCTDGFWEYISGTEMQTDLQKATSAKAWAENMLARISKRLPEGSDNYSVLCSMVL